MFNMNFGRPTRPAQTSALPMQAAVVPATTMASQFDMNTMFNMMIPLIMMVMMVKMIGGAMGSGEMVEAK